MALQVQKILNTSAAIHMNKTERCQHTEVTGKQIDQAAFWSGESSNVPGLTSHGHGHV